MIECKIIKNNEELFKFSFKDLNLNKPCLYSEDVYNRIDKVDCNNFKNESEMLEYCENWLFDELLKHLPDYCKYLKAFIKRKYDNYFDYAKRRCKQRFAIRFNYFHVDKLRGSLSYKTDGVYLNDDIKIRDCCDITEAKREFHILVCDFIDIGYH